MINTRVALLFSILIGLPHVAAAEPKDKAPALTAAPEVPFLDTYPHLRNLLFREPDSGFRFGMGIEPIGMLKDRVYFSFNFFQVHYIKDRINWEVLNASYGQTIAQQSAFQSKNFVFRTAPKFRFSDMLSAGPLIGYEFLSFPNIKARLYKAPYISPSEPFSSRGMIYGFMASQTFHYKENLLQVSEVFFKQTYSVEETPEHWTYIYDDPNVQADQKLIGPNMVIMVEVSYLF
jgi:hypothetical protein